MPRTPAVLPAMVFITPSCDWMCRQNMANARGIPLARFEDELTVEVTGPLEMKLLNSWLYVDLSIVGRADFDGDGCEDLLVISDVGGIGGIWTGGTWSATEYYILSRGGPDEVMRVVGRMRICAVSIRASLPTIIRRCSASATSRVPGAGPLARSLRARGASPGWPACAGTADRGRTARRRRPWRTVREFCRCA